MGSIGGAGSVTLGAGAYLGLNGGTVSIASIVFGAGGGETLNFGAPNSVSSTLSGFGSGDRIVLADVAASSLHYAHGTLTLFDANHAVVDTLAFAGNYKTADFSLEQKGHATDIVYAGSDAPALAHLPDFMAPEATCVSDPWVAGEPAHMHLPSLRGAPAPMAWLFHGNLPAPLYPPSML